MRGNFQKVLFVVVLVVAALLVGRNSIGNSGVLEINGDDRANIVSVVTGREIINVNGEGGSSLLDSNAGESFGEGEDYIYRGTLVGDTGFRRVANEPVYEKNFSASAVVDLESETFYFEHNKNKQWPLASITKLMTAVIVEDNFAREKTITLSNEDFDKFGDWIGVLEAGESYSVDDLIWAALLSSSNEAVNALARTYGWDSFIEKMNSKATEWGLSNTHFSDPAGLSVSSQSTVFDIVILVGRIYNDYPDILERTRRQGWTIKELESGKFKKIYSNNEFAGHYNFLGGKTGYTDEAVGNLISLFSYKERPVVVVIFGSSDRFGVTESLYSWFRFNFE